MCPKWREKRRLYKVAKIYQNFAHMLCQDGPNHPENWDCDVRLKFVRSFLKEEGLINKCELLPDGIMAAHGDYVVERGIVNENRYIRIRMRGDYIVDPGRNNIDNGFARTWPKEIIWEDLPPKTR